MESSARKDAMTPTTPKFSKMHYEFFATSIKSELYHTDYNDGVVIYALNLASQFKRDNDRFDPIKFLHACSPDPDSRDLAELWEGGS